MYHHHHHLSTAALPDRHRHLCTSNCPHRRRYEKAGIHEWTGREGRPICTIVWDHCGRAVRVTRAPNTIAQHLVERASLELGDIHVRADVPIRNRGGKVLVERERLVDDRVGYRCGSIVLGAMEGRGARRDDQGSLCD